MMSVRDTAIRDVLKSNPQSLVLDAYIVWGPASFFVVHNDVGWPEKFYAYTNLHIYLRRDPRHKAIKGFQTALDAVLLIRALRTI